MTMLKFKRDISEVCYKESVSEYTRVIVKIGKIQHGSHNTFLTLVLARQVWEGGQMSEILGQLTFTFLLRSHQE